MRSALPASLPQTVEHVVEVFEAHPRGPVPRIERKGFRRYFDCLSQGVTGLVGSAKLAKCRRQVPIRQRVLGVLRNGVPCCLNRESILAFKIV